jgi:hypothetical protein
MNRPLQINPMTETTPTPQPWNFSQSMMAWYTAPSELELLAAGFDPISLREMDSVALLDRIDTKFVMTTRQLLQALAGVQNDYWMLSIQGQRLNHYRTLYFDTQDFALYHAHVNERAERYKVRSREYIESQIAFLEVKHKTQKDRTIKDRIPTGQMLVEMTDDTTGWLHSISPLDGAALEPKIWNTFTRMTLVNKCCCERVTLDVDVAFSMDERECKLDGLAIAEVKMDANRRNSSFLEQMRAQRIRQEGFSKYSVGVAMLYDQVKKNAMKPRLLWIEKMLKEM